MRRVEAVLVKRVSGAECANCGEPLAVLPDELELGTVFIVDLDSRETVPVGVEGGHDGLLEVIQVAEGSQRGRWVPVDLFMAGGRAL